MLGRNAEVSLFWGRSGGKHLRRKIRLTNCVSRFNRQAWSSAVVVLLDELLTGEPAQYQGRNDNAKASAVSLFRWALNL